MTATASVEQAARGEGMSALARWGLAARASIYLLIGVLALMLALGSPRAEADQRGALQEVTRHNGGTVVVWIITIGLAAYALWRFSEAAFGVVGEGKKVPRRLQSFARGLIYAFFAVNGVRLLTHANHDSQANQQQAWTAKTMQHTGGRWVVGIVGAIVVVCGLVLAWEGVTRRFERYLELGRMTPGTRKIVRILGVVGTVARGVVFAIAGALVIVAAVDFKPQKARGLDRALRELADTSGGPWLLVAAAIGLMIFGVYGYAEAIWRRT